MSSSYNYSYNVLINRFEAFAAGHLLIKRFTHGQIDLSDQLNDDQYPFMHVTPDTIEPVKGAMQFGFHIMFADIPRDKETKAEYQREVISDCVRLGQDLIAEIQNGLELFGFNVQLVNNVVFEPFMEEQKNTVTGVAFTVKLEVPWDWSACDIPAVWAVGGNSTGGSGSPIGLLLQVNGVNNVVQSELDLVAGTNVTLTDNGDGSVTIDATGGGGGGAGTVTSVALTAPAAFNVSGSPVTTSGTLALSAAGNASQYITGAGTLQTFPTIPAAQVNSDWDAVSGVAEILNKPFIPVNLDDLADVEASSPSLLATIFWNGSQWREGNVPLYTLSDVNIPTPTNGQVLTYNTTSGKWEAVTPASGGSVTSVGLTMPAPTNAAFSVSGSPVTTSGTLAVAANGTSDQYIDGTGALRTLPSTGGGGGQVLYFNGNVSQGTIGGNNYYELGTAANTGPAANFTRATTGVIARFITDVNQPNHVLIPSGVWTIDVYLSETGGGSNHAQILAKLYTYNGSTFTLVATSTMEEITNGNVPDLYSFSVSVPNTVTAATDRVHIEFDIQNTNGKTVTLYTEDGRIGEVHTTYAIGLSSLNGLTESTQNFATGTSGTDFAISSASGTHTFNLPTASAANRGALSSADWSTFNGKQDSIGLTTVGTNLATLANPSAVRYVRINADNTVSAISLATLKSELGLLRGVQTSNLTNANTAANTNITGCILALEANSSYIGRLIVSSGFTTTTGFNLLFTFPSGSTMNVGQISTAAVGGQFMQWQAVTSGTVLTNRLNQAVNQIGLAVIEIFITTGANSGNLTPAFVTSSNGQTATVYGNATHIQLEKIS
jgi:hypothetical protein